MTTRILTTLCLPIGAVLLLAGCGGGGSKANASTAPSTTATATAANSAFTKCLGDHGVTVPAGGFRPRGGNGQTPPTGSAPGTGNETGGSTPPRGSFPGNNDPKFRAAFDACRSKLPNGGRNGIGFSRNPQAFQAYTSCLRDHGVNVPTTTAGSGTTPGTRPDFRNDPKFAAANKTCRVLLPTNGSTTTTTVGS